MSKFKLLMAGLLTTAIPLSVSASSLQCSEEEFTSFMDSYRAGIDRAAERQRSTLNPEDWAKADFARKMTEDPSNFCEVIAQSDFRFEMPDFTALQDAWDALMALQMTNAKGVDLSTIITKAIQKGIEKAKEEIIKGACKLAQASLDGAVAGIVGSVDSYEKFQEKRFNKWLNDRELYQDYQLVANEKYEKLAWKKIDDREKERKHNQRRRDANKFLGTKLF